MIAGGGLVGENRVGPVLQRSAVKDGKQRNIVRRNLHPKDSEGRRCEYAGDQWRPRSQSYLKSSHSPLNAFFWRHKLRREAPAKTPISLVEAPVG